MFLIIHVPVKNCHDACYFELFNTLTFCLQTDLYHEIVTLSEIILVFNFIGRCLLCDNTQQLWNECHFTATHVTIVFTACDMDELASLIVIDFYFSICLYFCWQRRANYEQKNIQITNNWKTYSLLLRTFRIFSMEEVVLLSDCRRLIAIMYY